MPKVQLIFILHVSTYRYVFPLRLLPCWYVSCPKSCAWARNQQLLSCSPGSVYSALWKAVLTYQGHSLDPEDPIFKEFMFARFWRQCLPSIVSCQSLFADGFFSCRKSPGVRDSERCTQRAAGCKRCPSSRWLLVPRLSSAVAPSLQDHCLSLIIQAAGQTLFWVVFLFFFM